MWVLNTEVEEVETVQVVGGV